VAGRGAWVVVAARSFAVVIHGGGWGSTGRGCCGVGYENAAGESIRLGLCPASRQGTREILRCTPRLAVQALGERRIGRRS
jgi:hypothetical protein